MVMSARAYRSLRPEQIDAIEWRCEILPVEIPTIELAGGSVRCMIAGVHLDRRRAVEAGPSVAEAAIDQDPSTVDAQDAALEG